MKKILLVAALTFPLATMAQDDKKDKNRIYTNPSYVSVNSRTGNTIFKIDPTSVGARKIDKVEIKDNWVHVYYSNIISMAGSKKTYVREIYCEDCIISVETQTK